MHIRFIFIFNWFTHSFIVALSVSLLTLPYSSYACTGLHIFVPGYTDHVRYLFIYFLISLGALSIIINIILPLLFLVKHITRAHI
jgi:hypothetical protein